MSTETWEEIYDLVGRIQHRAIESENWQLAKDAERITALLQNLSEEIHLEDWKASRFL